MRDISKLNTEFLKNKKIAIFGFGAQGMAQSLNLKDGGFECFIALKKDSHSIIKAKEEGFKVMEPADASKIADIIVLLTPDETHAESFEKEILPNFKKGGSIIVAHGFSFHFGYVKNYQDFNIGMVAPKAVGKAVRKNFLENKGIFSLIAKFHEVNSQLNIILPEFAKAIGSIKILETDFKTECETDLFGEQAVLCGGVVSLFKNAFDVLVEAGYPPLIAYYECVHELKLIVDLIYEKGVSSMFSSISNTAKYGGFKTGDFLIDNSVKERMKEVLAKIQDGNFARSFMNAAIKEKYLFKKEIDKLYSHQTEIIKAGDEVIKILK